MSDDASTIQLQILRAMSAERKLEIAQQLREAAWAMKAAGVRLAHPEFTEAMIQNQVRQIFLRADS